MKYVNTEDKKLTKRERDMEASFDAGYQRAKREDADNVKMQMEKLQIEKLKAKGELIKTVAELVPQFNKMMYHVNCILNDKGPFNGS